VSCTSIFIVEDLSSSPSRHIIHICTYTGQLKLSDVLLMSLLDWASETDVTVAWFFIEDTRPHHTISHNHMSLAAATSGIERSRSPAAESRLNLSWRSRSRGRITAGRRRRRKIATIHYPVSRRRRCGRPPAVHVDIIKAFPRGRCALVNCRRPRAATY